MAGKLNGWEQEQAAAAEQVAAEERHLAAAQHRADATQSPPAGVAGDPPTGDAGRDDSADSAVASRPANSATVAVWRAYAELLGIDPTGLTKAEIIEGVDALD